MSYWRVFPLAAQVALFSFLACAPPTEPADGGTTTEPVDGGPHTEPADAGPTEPADAGRSAGEIEGAIAKGPFILGSSITVAVVDESAAATGQVFLTETTNDLGEFRTGVGGASFVRIEGVGFYYNEISGSLSSAPLTLRALAEVPADSVGTAFVNVVTHLAAPRAQRLIEGDTPFGAAIDQAEGELRTALGIGPAAFDPESRGTEMDIVGGGNPAAAYLFAVSSVLVKAAEMRGGPVDASLQELMSIIATDLTEDGVLLPAQTDALRLAEEALDTATIEQALAARILSLGSLAAAPDLDTMIDTDGDGVVNTDDTCVRDADPAQLDADLDGIGDACECGNGSVDVSTAEACDDGDTIAAVCDYGVTECTVCSSTCSFVPGATSFCGDGVVRSDQGETCDDENAVTEECEYGEMSCSVCSATCTLVPGEPSWCGDGVVDASTAEACDDGDTIAAVCDYGVAECTVCSSTCSFVLGATSFCGDGVIRSDQGETCDDGNAVTEECDYGEMSCSVCGATCTMVAGEPSWCGDGVVDGSAGENCEDLNVVTEDCTYGQWSCIVCGPACALTDGNTSYCRDGVIDADVGEVCDDGEGPSDGGYPGDPWTFLPTCALGCRSLNPYCGDGILDPNEACDEAGATAICSAACVIIP